MPRRRPDLQPDLFGPGPPKPSPKQPSSIPQDPAELAKLAVAKRYKPGASGRLKVPLTLFLDRGVIERLTERALREGKSLVALVEEILERERKDPR